MSAQLVVPAVTSEPNRWWVEQLRLTGRLDEPEEFIASKGGAGFRTQRLVDVEVRGWSVTALAGTISVRRYRKRACFGCLCVGC